MAKRAISKCGAYSADEVPERPLDTVKGCLLAFALILLPILAAAGMSCGNEWRGVAG